MRRSIIASSFIGLLAALATFLLPAHAGNVGDFFWALDIAQALLQGRDPYGFVADPLHIPYPLPAAVVGLPLVWLPWPLASSLFLGLSSALLAWGILRANESWRLWMLASFPFFTALYFRQWSPLITATWFIPVLAPLLVLIKPQIALPIAAQRLTWRGLALAGAVLVASLVVDPTWPLRWIRMLGPYERVIPILQLPFGPLLLLAALHWRERRARLLLLMSILPMRGLYDLCSLWIIPSTRRQSSALSLASWLMFPVMAADLNTAAWVIPILYLPALVMVLYPWVTDKWSALRRSSAPN